MKAILKKDIVIPAGTELEAASEKPERYGEGHVEALVELTKDSTARLNLFIEPADHQLHQWFDVIQ